MDQKQQVAEKLKQANNILVTVSNNPSVDQLAACIGLALLLNKLGKHATAVFSGTVPSTIEFLKPEETLEDNVDSLRDFIISLDKSKADKLRYKVEDTVVKIFITPYRTAISDKDLEFSQGDFNVDAVVALGVQAQADIDQAIAAHGRILHDAVVVTINTQPGGEFGGVNWVDPAASSLCELVAGLAGVLDKQIVDAQIATALLTGIVAETDRFSNEKTTPATMSISATLMSAGANQQLVVAKLEEAAAPPPAPEQTPEQAPAPAPEQVPGQAPAPAPDAAAPGEVSLRQADSGSPAGAPNEGTLSVQDKTEPEAPKPDEEAKPVANLEDLAGPESKAKEEPKLARIHIDEQGALHSLDDKKDEKEEKSAPTTDPTVHMGSSRMILQPPSVTGGGMSGGGLAGEAYNDPLAAPKAADPAAEQPSSAPAPPPSASSPFMPPASASITPPPTPFMPPSMTPGPAAPPPAPQPAGPAPAAGPSPSGPPDLAPAPADSARSTVAQAFGAAPPPTAPPDLSVPVPASAPLPPSGPSIPAPVGPPPPVPPPMLPN